MIRKAEKKDLARIAEIHILQDFLLNLFFRIPCTLTTCLFLLSGITMQHYLLVIWSVIFGIGHIFVTNKNRVE